MTSPPQCARACPWGARGQLGSAARASLPLIRNLPRPDAVSFSLASSSFLRDARRHRRVLPARGRPQLPAVRRALAALSALLDLTAVCVRVVPRAVHARGKEPAGSAVQRPAAHRQRRRTAPVLPLLGAQRPAQVSARAWGRALEGNCACVIMTL